MLTKQRVTRTPLAMETTRSIIDALGRRQFLMRSGLSKQALIRPFAENQFPANWFQILDEMCAERGIDCPRDLFAFRRPFRDSDGLLPEDLSLQAGNKKIQKKHGLTRLNGEKNAANL